MTDADVPPKAFPMDPGHRTDPAQTSRLAAEVLGTFLLVFGGVGAAVLASAFPTARNTVGIGFVGVALAFGLSVVGAGYAVGHVSGGHFNPAITVGLAIARRFPARSVGPYIIAQIIGGILGTTVLFLIVANGPDGKLRTVQAAGFGSNGYGDHSPGGYNLLAVAIAEIVLTAIFVYVVLGVTDNMALPGFGPLAIGLTLTLIHLVSIPVDNTAVNPARAIAAAVYGGPAALGQLWIFLLAPLVGAAIAGITYRALFVRPDHHHEHPRRRPVR